MFTRWVYSKPGKVAVILLVIFVGVVYLNNTWLLVEPPGDGPLLLAHRAVGQPYDRTGLTNQTCTAAKMIPVDHAYLENTIPSMAAAFDYGADIVEFDVHQTADDRFAVFHDWTIDCRTEGTGVTREQTLDTLQALDIGYGYTADDGQTKPLAGIGVAGCCPRWSPDRQQVAFSIGAGMDKGIYVVDAEGGAPRLLMWRRRTEGDSPPWQPVWSPDSRHLAVGDDNYIYLIHVEQPESGVTRLPHSEGADGIPSWSPDGQRLAFAVNTPDLYNDDHHIRVISLAGDEPIPLTEGESDNHTPIWSPDGQHILFISDRSGNDELFLINPDGGNLRPLTNTPDRERHPAWSSDSQQIAYTVENQERTDIYLLRLDGSEPRLLFHRSWPQVWEPDGRQPVWSPDGNAIAFTDFLLNADDPTKSDTVIYTTPVTEISPTAVLTRSVTFWGLDW